MSMQLTAIETNAAIAEVCCATQKPLMPAPKKISYAASKSVLHIGSSVDAI